MNARMSRKTLESADEALGELLDRSGPDAIPPAKRPPLQKAHEKIRGAAQTITWRGLPPDGKRLVVEALNDLAKCDIEGISGLSESLAPLARSRSGRVHPRPAKAMPAHQHAPSLRLTLHREGGHAWAEVDCSPELAARVLSTWLDSGR